MAQVRKDLKLPPEGFRYGASSAKGVSVEDTIKAGQVVGVAEYKQSVAERVYDSTKKEPLGKPYVRGHNLQMLPQGYGNPSAALVDGKSVIYPVDVPPDSEEVRKQYRYTHGDFAPGEQANPKYAMPELTTNSNFRFGVGTGAPPQGRGAKLALNMECDEQMEHPPTRMVNLTCEAKMRQGKAPPVPPGTRFGIKSTNSETTARSCIQGFYSLKEQLPDQDLGCCITPGRRNVTVETRAFGTPSLRTDIPAPHPDKRSVANCTAYGDQCGAASLLNPHRFDMQGVADAEFLVRRPKEDVKPLVANLDLPDLDFESLWQEALGLFDDDQPLVSLDALLHVLCQKADAQ
jgi:hypothetical protein